ncbi:DNA alkylation repair protein, partial [Peptoniphilus sp.]|uniref:DNA alkylation repair protein n=1 Tax=Peptoniphilus sp. TaxID=1971214 RepID=UPI003D8C19D8
MNAKEKLFELQDKKYRVFQSKLVPNIEDEKIIGVRVPDLRKISKIFDDIEMREFLDDLPHYYYDENILHGILISNIKDYESCIKEINKFLPFIDNWAV